MQYNSIIKAFNALLHTLYIEINHFMKLYILRLKHYIQSFIHYNERNKNYFNIFKNNKNNY